MDDWKQQDFDQPVGLVDQTLLPVTELAVSVTDKSFIHGITVSEQLRTFQQRPFLLKEHFQRWERGLAAIGHLPPCSFEVLADRIDTVVRINARFLPPDCEQGICFFATAGSQPSFCWTGSQDVVQTTKCFIHSYPLPRDRLRESYERGVALRTTSILDTPPECWPPTVKLRSRLHYYLAQQEAERIQPGAHPILLDSQGYVSDSAIGSIVGYWKSQGVVVRPQSVRYASISVDFILQLASRLGLPICERLFSVQELQAMDEVWLASTPWCLLPVRMIDGISINGPSDFPVCRQLLSAWSSAVGVSIS
jgi:branched-chain amino acid aminotransferase